MFEEGTGKLADQGCWRKDGVPEADNLVELEITEAGNPDETQDETDQNDGGYPGIDDARGGFRRHRQWFGCHERSWSELGFEVVKRFGGDGGGLIYGCRRRWRIAVDGPAYFLGWRGKVTRRNTQRR